MVQVKIDGTGKLKGILSKLAAKFGDNPKESVTVGFTQRYALWVHEINAYHKVGQWKYLETPARQLKPEMANTVKKALTQGIPLLQSLMLAGLRLQRTAQQITPVDTSALKASAFTCPTKDVEAVSQAAFIKSEAIRKSELAARSKNGKKTP